MAGARLLEFRDPTAAWERGWGVRLTAQGKRQCDAVAEKMGFGVDLQAGDLGTLIQRDPKAGLWEVRFAKGSVWLGCDGMRRDA